jgi:hypothetical protein
MPHEERKRKQRERLRMISAALDRLSRNPDVNGRGAD